MAALFGAAAIDTPSTAATLPLAWRLHMQRGRRWLLVALAAVLAMIASNIVHARDRDALAQRSRAVAQATELLATQIGSAVQSAATPAQMLLSLSEQRPDPRDITRTLEVPARPGAFGWSRNLLTSALGAVALSALLSAIVSLWRAGRAVGRNIVSAEGHASAVELSNDDVDAARRVASVAAHEVNNLLTTMSFDAEMVAELYPGNLRLAQLSRSMLAAAGRGAVLTQNLLAYAEGALLHPRLVDICAELRARQADLVACLPPGQTLIIGRTTFAKRGELVRLDPAALTLSLGALLADCTEAAAMRAEIRIDVICEMRRDVPYEVVVIETAGMGLDLDGLGHHAEPQLGLGAAAAAGFARQSGGFLAIEYTADHSLRARFGFPICNGVVPQSDSRQQPWRECASRAGRSGAISPRPTVRVLLVDDCEPVRDSIARRLRAAGYAVLEAQDAAHAEILARRGVDVLLTDIVLTGGADGGALAKRVRAHIPTLPVVFMSGYLSVRQPEVMAGDELASFVRKPIEVGDLCTLIDGLIALRESRRLAQPAA